MGMTQTKLQPKTKPAPTLDALYTLIGDDLKRVDQLILDRVRHDVPLISQIVHHIVASGGKRIRPALTLISSQLCGYQGERHIGLAAAVEFIHTATLLHDDVVDESKLRRGMPTANEAFGNKASVLVGDFLFSQAFQCMVADGSLRVLEILSGASAVIARGEVMQLMTEGEPNTSIDNYMEVIKAKTAVLFAAACELGAVVSGLKEKEEALHQFGMDLGIAFQLIDDALDYASDDKTLGKTVGDDFREGKITLPIILAYQASNTEERSFWDRCITQQEQTEADLPEALRILAKYNTIGATIDTASRYCAQARTALSSFADCAAKAAMLDIVDFCESRAY
jgi:octaprenyl-diphosphate synthase